MLALSPSKDVKGMEHDVRRPEIATMGADAPLSATCVTVKPRTSHARARRFFGLTPEMVLL
jgi:hypothetical protein